MAVLRFPNENRIVENEAEIRAELAAAGIDYERWSLDRVPVASSADVEIGRASCRKECSS